MPGDDERSRQPRGIEKVIVYPAGRPFQHGAKVFGAYEHSQAA